jgi:hypothetical protein
VNCLLGEFQGRDPGFETGLRVSRVPGKPLRRRLRTLH